MATAETPLIVQCGREITVADIEHVKDVVGWCSNLSRKELAHTICEHWGWVTATGRHKMQACLNLLLKLEERGDVRLPAMRPGGRSPQRRPDRTARTAPRSKLHGGLSEVTPVTLQVVSQQPDMALWNEYVDRYHYLGYKQPFGCTVRYLVTCDQGPLGCLLLAGASKSLGVRDGWIGWSAQRRLQNLPWVINNTRFLVFPWVWVRHLASHVLGQLARRVGGDWQQRWGYRPVLMETFVDPARYRGISYRAAGWTLLGATTGEGLRRPGRSYQTTPKLLYVRPLVRDFREQLCSSPLQGRASE